MLNLSLLTSDMWSVVIRVVAYHEKVCDHLVFCVHVSYWVFCMSKSSRFLQVDWLYYLAFAAVIIGLITYSVYVISIILHSFTFPGKCSLGKFYCSVLRWMIACMMVTDEFLIFRVVLDVYCNIILESPS